MKRIAKQYFKPLFVRLSEVIRSGVATGEFRAINPVQFVPSMVALVVFYFISAPVMRNVAGFDPLSSERIAERRAAVLDFIASALFQPASMQEGAGR